MSDDLDATFDNEDDFARVCYYGDPGTGKTIASSSLAKLGKTLVYPFEPGLKKVALQRHDIPLGNLVRAKKMTTSEMMDTFWSLKAKLDKNPGSFVGAVWDSVTHQTEQVRKSTREAFYDNAVRQAEARGEDYDKPKNWMPRELYGDLAEDIGEVIAHFHDLPIHLAFTAHVRRDVDEDSGDTVYGPATTPAVQKFLVGYVDVLMRVRDMGRFEDGSRVLIGTTSNGGNYQVKDRLGVLPSPHMLYPTMDRIVAYVNGDLTPESDPLQKKWEDWAAKARKKKEQ